MKLLVARRRPSSTYFNSFTFNIPVTHRSFQYVLSLIILSFIALTKIKIFLFQSAILIPGLEKKNVRNLCVFSNVYQTFFWLSVHYNTILKLFAAHLKKC